MSTADNMTAPKHLRAKTVEARLLKQKIWDRLWKDNEHFMCCVVGREGSGKSQTGLKIGEACDPTFSAERVMFSPKQFLERLREWKANGETQGKIVVADEAGVGVGVRTWHDKEQILFNQVLQVIRDENMGMVFTVPRLSELDSQTRGRLHALIEMTDMEAGEWAEAKWLNWDPTRDERDKVYRHYPELKVDGWKRKVKRLKLSPPSQELVDAYETRKEAFQNSLYEEAVDEMSEEDKDSMSAKDIAMNISEEGIEPFVSKHNQTKQPYINKELIRAEFEVSHSDASTAKSLLEKQYGDKELASHA